MYPIPLFRSLALLGLLLCSTGSAWSARIEIYRGEVAVSDQSPEQRSQALARALAQVAIKASGDRSAPQTPAVASRLREAERNMAGFQYRNDVSLDAQGVPQQQTVLVVDFAPQLIQAMLDEAGLALWGSQRPTPLVWIIEDAGLGERRMLGENDRAELAALFAQASARGIGFVLPLLDLEDQAQVSMQGLWGGFREEIERASSRYQSSVVLAGRLSQQAGLWSARWLLLDNGKEYAFDLRSESRDDLLSDTADQVADELARRYALRAGERIRSEARVVIEGIDDALAYARALNNLGGLSFVEGMRPELAAGDRLLIRMELSASLERFLEAVNFGQTFSVISHTPNDPAEQARLRLEP